MLLYQIHVKYNGKLYS